LKKFASVGVSLLAVVVTMAMMAGPADARARRHHRHHRGGGGGGGVTCGPGTTLVGGVCVANPPTGPIGNGNVAISPSSITMNLDGSFSASAVVSGLPPAIPIGAVTAAATCGPAGTFAALPLGPVDALGRLQLLIFKGAPGCVPGTYPIVIAEGASPFQSFTGFVQLHF
jgi:hypothetical protein